MPLYKREGSEVWWVSISEPGQPRVRRSTGTTDRAAAEKREREIQIEVWTARPDPAAGYTWGQAVIAWLNVETRSDSELLSLAKFGRVFPDRPLGEVSREAIDEALSFCKTPGTYMRYRTMIAAVLNLAKVAGWLPVVPLLAVRRDKKKKKRDWLTREQWDALYAELPPHLKPTALFAVETGLRQSNVLNLTWDRVDLDRRVVWIEAEDTKADAALAIPLNDAAVAVLKAQKEAPVYVSKRGARAKPNPCVFTFRGLSINDVKTAFIAACIRAGLGAYVSGDITHYEGFTWHGLRHTWATWHAQNGTPMEVLQKLGGWSDPRMVSNYAHHAPGFIAGYAGNTRKEG
jgi:integrase